MRICLVTHYYEPELGAPQQRWSALVPRFVAAGHEVEVLAPLPHYPHGRAAPGLRPGVTTGRHGERVVRLPYVPYRRARSARLLDQAVTAAAAATRRPAADVVLATAPGLPSLGAGRVLARRTGAPLVIEMRDAWPDLVQDVGGAGAPAGRLAGLVTGWQRQAAAVVTVSAGFADRLRSRGVPRVAVVPNGVDLGRVPHLPPPGGEGGRLEALYLGTIGESQRLETAVRAAALLGPDACRLTVVGHGVDRDGVERLAEGLAAPVRLLPPVTGERLWDAYRAADTCLVSLRDWSAFSMTVPSKVYELLAVGRHVSASVRGETADIVRSAGGGDVVPPEDPEALAGLWRALATDRSRLRTSGAPRRWVAENADHDALADRYLDLLEDVVAGVRR